jgi:cytochrome b involved in lipid metabolism
MNIGDTVLRKDPGGEEVIRNIFTKEDLLKYYNDYYACDNEAEILSNEYIKNDYLRM